MARRPAQYGTAKVKERDAGRPLLVILLLVAVGIAVFLWLLPETSDAPMAAGPVEEPAPTVEVEVEPEPEPDRGPGVDDWWDDVEGTIYDAFRAAEAEDCAGLEYAARDLAESSSRPEPAIAASYDGLVSNFQRAAEACESRPETLQGIVTSASRRLQNLVEAGRSYGLEPSSLLEDYL